MNSILNTIGQSDLVEASVKLSISIVKTDVMLCIQDARQKVKPRFHLVAFRR